MSDEEWCDIPGYEGFYQASTLGRIRSVKRVVPHDSGAGERRMPGKIIQPWGHSKDGRPIVALSREGFVKKRGVHILVALAFIGLKPHSKSQCCHRDGNVHNNTPGNLYWGDNSTNVQDAIRHGTFAAHNKLSCPWGHKLSAPNLKSGTRNGARACRACANASEWARKLGIKGRPPTPAEVRIYADRRYIRIMEAAA